MTEKIKTPEERTLELLEEAATTGRRLRPFQAEMRNVNTYSVNKEGDGSFTLSSNLAGVEHGGTDISISFKINADGRLDESSVKLTEAGLGEANTSRTSFFTGMIKRDLSSAEL